MIVKQIGSFDDSDKNISPKGTCKHNVGKYFTWSSAEGPLKNKTGIPRLFTMNQCSVTVSRSIGKGGYLNEPFTSVRVC